MVCAALLDEESIYIYVYIYIYMLEILPQLVAFVTCGARLPAAVIAFIDDTAGYGKDTAVNRMLSAFWSMAAHQGWLVKFERVPSKADVADAVSPVEPRRKDGPECAAPSTRSCRSSPGRQRTSSMPTPTRPTSCSTHRASTSEPARGGESVRTAGAECAPAPATHSRLLRRRTVCYSATTTRGKRKLRRSAQFCFNVGQGAAVVLFFTSGIPEAKVHMAICGTMCTGIRRLRLSKQPGANPCGIATSLGIMAARDGYV